MTCIFAHVRVSKFGSVSEALDEFKINISRGHQSSFFFMFREK